MKIKLPNFINILGRKIPIKYLDEQEMAEETPGAGGAYHQWERKIHISNEAPLNVQLYWIFHEMVHASQHFTGIDQRMPAEFEEIICQTTATLIEDILNSDFPEVYKKVKKQAAKK